MILSVITLIWLLNSALSVKLPVTIEEVTSPAVRFNQYVFSMIVHPTDPRLLIVIDRFAIWEFNPETKTKTLIAGSSTRGYVEGFGENARFGSIYGSANFNKTTIIITSYNHCMRLVNTETRLTERYAGVCQSYGFKDGDSLSAQFSDPWGISRIGSDFYVCDQNNKKIRKISQNVVSTITSVSYYPLALSSNNDKLIYTFSNGLGEFDPNTQSNKILTGGSSSGYTDGSLSSAQFSAPYDVIPLAENLFAIIDYYNQAVRIVDLNKQFVSSVDLSGSPWSVLAYNGNIMVGMYGGSILKFNMSELPVTQFNIKCEKNLTLSLASSDYSVLFQPQIETSPDFRCADCADQNISLGAHKFTYTYFNKIGYVQKICEQTVTVVAVAASVKCPDNIRHVLPEGTSSLSVSVARPDISRTRLECYSCPYANLQLSVGNHYVTFTYKDKLTKESVSCSYTIEVINCQIDVEVNCPDDSEMILPPGVNELNIALPRPQVDELRLKCIHNCLNSVQTLSEGVHNITYEYMDISCNRMTSCSYLINVTKFVDVEVNCPDDSEMILPPGVNELNITLPRPQVDELRLKCIHNCLDSVQSLSEGVHNITYDYMDIVYNQTTSCSYLINVTKQSTPVRLKPDVKLEYLSLLSLLIIMVVIPVIILLCKKRQTMETRAEGDRRSINMINMNRQVNRNSEYDEDGIGSVHEYEVMPDEQEQSPNNRQSMQSDDGYAETYVDRCLCSQPVVQETGLTNDGYEVPDSHRPVPPHV